MNPKIKLQIKDANQDVYEQEFEVEYNQEEGSVDIICPLCGEILQQNMGYTCANGHIAYTIIDEDAEEKALAAIQEA
jgi:hypothetical protein